MEQLLDCGLQIAATLLVTLIGVLGAFLTSKLAASAKLQNIDAAQKELIRAAKLTVGELQQTIVSGLKAARADGKLTAQEVETLKGMLLDRTMQKLSQPAYALLKAAAVDIEALIAGAGESFIDQMHTKTAA